MVYSNVSFEPSSERIIDRVSGTFGRKDYGYMKSIPLDGPHSEVREHYFLRGVPKILREEFYEAFGKYLQTNELNRAINLDDEGVRKFVDSDIAKAVVRDIRDFSKFYAIRPGFSPIIDGALMGKDFVSQKD